MHPEVRQTIRRYDLLPAGTRVAVALSGGPDSVALLHVLLDLAPDMGFILAGVAHLNHMLRGADADADEAFCRELAASLDIPLVAERVDVAALARASRRSLERAAHDARLAFFARAARRLDAAAVAVAHTRDDQAETYMLRLLRGAGPRGLGGMHPRSHFIVRPFLNTSRSDVHEFIAERGLVFRRDASNEDLGIRRNRVRHELMPFLASRFTPNIVGVLDRNAAIAREDDDYIERAADQAAARILTRMSGRIELSVPALLAEPPAIGRRVLRNAQQEVARERFVGFEAVDAVLALVVSNQTGPLDLPGHRVNRLGETLVLNERAERRQSGPALATLGRTSGFLYELGVPGRVSVPEAGCVILAAAESVSTDERLAGRLPLKSRSDMVALDGVALGARLVVRSWREGDRFRPLGLGGRKKLQDLFVDEKIARFERDKVPLIVDSKGRIAWVAGLSVAEEFKVTDRTTAVVILKREPA
jgi:tRNA(Ile)-lysidine synthase